MHHNIFSFAKFYRFLTNQLAVLSTADPFSACLSISGMTQRYRATRPSAHAHPTCWNRLLLCWLAIVIAMRLKHRI